MSDEFWKGVWESISEKTSSPIYFTYLGFSIIWNFKFLHVLFIEKQEALGMPKIEYAGKLYPFETNWFLNSDPVITELINGTLGTMWHLIPPAILTFFAVVYLPKVHAWAHSIYLRNYFERRKAWDRADLEYQETLTKKTVKEAEEQVKKSIAKRNAAKTLTKEETWENEFGMFIKNPESRRLLLDVVTNIYRGQGIYTTVRHLSDDQTPFIEPSVISQLHAMDLIELAKGNNTWNSSISLTEKGKMFYRNMVSQSAI